MRPIAFAVLILVALGQAPAAPASGPCASCVTSPSALPAGNFAIGAGNWSVRTLTPAQAAAALAPFLPGSGGTVDTAALNRIYCQQNAACFIAAGATYTFAASVTSGAIRLVPSVEPTNPLPGTLHIGLDGRLESWNGTAWSKYALAP